VVRAAHDQATASTSAGAAQALRATVRDEVSLVSREALLCKRRIDALYEATRHIADDPRLAQLFPAVIRMRDNIVLQVRGLSVGGATVVHATCNAASTSLYVPYRCEYCPVL
jgi:hypothetical protein